MNDPNILIREQYDTLGIESELYEEGLHHFTAAHYAVERQGTVIEELENPFSEVAVRLQLAAEEGADMEELTQEPAFVLGVVGAVSARRETRETAEMVAAMNGNHGGSE